MGGTRWLCVSLALVACCLQAQGVDKYTDENRPYEFGFNIEGEQHRHEKKDENGLIEGEFGFLTADGVYHVTVYATDENGNFHIRSMKNIRVKPYPGSERQGKVLPVNQPPQQALQPPQQALQPPPKTQSVSSPPAPLKPVVLEKPGRSCSHCSIPTSSPAPVPVVPQNPSYNEGQDSFGGQPESQGEQGFAGGNYGQGQGTFVGGQGDQGFQGGQGGQGGQGNAYGGQSSYGAQGGGNGGLTQNDFGQPGQNNFQNPQPGFDNSQYGQQQPAQQPQEGFNGQGQEGVGNAQSPQGISDSGVSGQRNPKQFEPSYNENTGVNPNYPSKPTLISAQMKIVDSNTDVNRLGPGESPGLPNGLTKNDMQNLLYTFNYTVGFHGHQEEGYANGAKKGHYFITGRNGIRTRVDYEADENGFRPKITQEVLDVLSDEVPKPETEKDEKFGLKHYEFRWIYFPTNRR